MERIDGPAKAGRTVLNTGDMSSIGRVTAARSGQAGRSDRHRRPGRARIHDVAGEIATSGDGTVEMLVANPSARAQVGPQQHDPSRPSPGKRADLIGLAAAPHA